MKILLVTEKFNPIENQRDGGSRLVHTLQKSFGDCLKIMQFGNDQSNPDEWIYKYPLKFENRFEQRMANASFIAQKIEPILKGFTHIIFVHVSMQFAFSLIDIPPQLTIITFPMFLSPSYEASDEIIPDLYKTLEQKALSFSHMILTPSYLEKRQLMQIYQILEHKIHVIPRGVDTKFLKPKKPRSQGFLKLCSIGSIKPQKNTFGLIKTFSKFLKKCPDAKLKIIGPIQNEAYYELIKKEIETLKIGEAIIFNGYAKPDEIAQLVEDEHIHVSFSNCETFGRSIFETLAMGLPNIAFKSNNAAAEFLENKPYIKFIENETCFENALNELLSNLDRCSELACEIGELFNDEFLSKLLMAKIKNDQKIVISDFDGTLFHKLDDLKTHRSMEFFKKQSPRIICSARSITNLLEQLKNFNLEVDWLIGLSGAVISDGWGNILWCLPMNENDKKLVKDCFPQAEPIEVDGKTVQYKVDKNVLQRDFPQLRVETYQNHSYISDWKASKLHAVIKLLQHLKWVSQVDVYGDGPYDLEILRFFDGVLIGFNSHDGVKHRKEIIEN